MSIQRPSADLSVAAAAIERLPHVAILPVVAMTIMQLATAEQTTASMLTDVVRRDPPTAARLLKLANSSFYGRKREVSSVDEAVVVLDDRAIRTVALASSLTQLHGGQEVFTGFQPVDLWKHSIGVASCAALLASRDRRVNLDDAFLAGLWRSKKRIHRSSKSSLSTKRSWKRLRLNYRVWQVNSNCCSAPPKRNRFATQDNLIRSID